MYFQHLTTALSASLAVTDVTTTTSLVTLFLRFSNSDMNSQRLIKRLVRAADCLGDVALSDLEPGMS